MDTHFIDNDWRCEMGFQEVLSDSIGSESGIGIYMTKHAGIRVQQRGVQQDVLGCLLDYGHHEPDHRGCHVVTFDSRSFRELPYQASRKRALDSRRLYAVVDSEGVVITAGHRFRRIPRDLSLSSLRPGRSRSPRVLNSPRNPYRI